MLNTVCLHILNSLFKAMNKSSVEKSKEEIMQMVKF